MDRSRHPLPEPLGAPRVDITLCRPPAGSGWQAEVVVDGQHLRFEGLIALIGWLTRLDAPRGGIR